MLLNEKLIRNMIRKIILKEASIGLDSFDGNYYPADGNLSSRNNPNKEDFETGEVEISNGIQWGDDGYEDERKLAFQALSYFLPNGTKLTSCYRSQDDQNRIIKNYALKNNYSGDQNDYDKMHKFITDEKGLIVGRNVGRGHGGKENTGAFDLSGVSLDTIWKGVENANESELLKGKIKFAGLNQAAGNTSIIEKENNAVHVHFNISDVNLTNADIENLKKRKK